MSAVVDALKEATIRVDEPATRFVPARWALVLRLEDDPVVAAAAVRRELAELQPHVSPLSSLDPEVLVVELPDRIFGLDQADAFAAARLLVTRFDLDAAEPDLPTDLSKDGRPRRPGADEEGLGDLLFWCFAPAEPELDQDPRWALEVMNVEKAWDFSRQRQRPSEGQGVVIAQPDTGITDHPELADVDRVPGWNALHGNSDPTDPMDYLGNRGHGTGTASVVVSPVAGAMSGSAPRARHMAIRAVESVVLVRQVALARSVDWAVEHGASVITLSLGGLPSPSMHRALTRAVAADVIVLAAAGNCADAVVFPARYDDCIAVAGTDRHDERWRGSCRGPAVDVSAPGENVIRADAGAGTVGQSQGTSFAVALTAGVAALWLAHHGRANLVAAARARGETLSVMFRRLLRGTARRPARWNSFEMGAGVVDARALLAADLDLNRGRESVQRNPNDRERAAVAVKSLVTELVGYDASCDEAVDWYRDGPEIAAILLRRHQVQSNRTATPVGDAGAAREETARAGRPGLPRPTRYLDDIVGQPDLRDALGLDRRSEPDPSLEGASR